MPRIAVTAPRRAVSNIVVNPSFEYAPAFTAATTSSVKYVDGTASGSATNSIYSWFTSFSGSCSAQFDTSVFYSGTTSMRVSTTATNAIALVYATYTDIPNLAGGTGNSGYVKIEPNTSYTLSGWMKTRYVSGDGRGAFFRLSDYTGARAAITSYSTTSVKTTTDWTFYSTTLTTGSTSQYGRIGLYTWGQDSPATLIMDAWFDDITLVKSPVQTRTANTFPQRKTPDNLLSNGNFEYAPPFTAVTTGNNVWIDGTTAGSGSTRQYGWSTSRSGTIEASFDSSVRYTGTNSLKLSTKATSSYVEARSVLSTTTARQREFATPLTPNTQYTLSGWMKTNVVSGDSEGASFGFYITDGTGAVVSYVGFPATQIKTTTDWTYYSRTITSPATTAGVIMVCRIYGHTGAGTLIMDAWFDDFTVTKVPADARTVVS